VGRTLLFNVALAYGLADIALRHKSQCGIHAIVPDDHATEQVCRAFERKCREVINGLGTENVTETRMASST
jgi:enhancing lycopene biosynthesis protein 2